MPAARPSLSRRDPRELARSPPLSQYERSQRAQENSAPPSRMTPANHDRFAELDAQNQRFPGAQIAPEDMVADSRQDLLTSVLAKPVSGSIGVLNPTGSCQGRELSLDP